MRSNTTPQQFNQSLNPTVHLAIGEHEIAITTPHDLLHHLHIDASAPLALVVRDGDAHEIVRIPFVANESVNADPEVVLGDILEQIGETPAYHAPTQTVDEVYTHGDCDVFAVALARLAGEGGTLHAILDPCDDRGEPAETPYLIHAGLRVPPGSAVERDDAILDIRGRTPETIWNMTWAENGHCFEPIVDVIDQEGLEEAQAQVITEKQIASALPYAAIILALCRIPVEAALLQAA